MEGADVERVDGVVLRREASVYLIYREALR